MSSELLPPEVSPERSGSLVFDGTFFFLQGALLGRVVQSEHCLLSFLHIRTPEAPIAKGTLTKISDPCHPGVAGN